MAKYDTKVISKNLSISKIADFIKPDSKVLDVGCATGYLGEVLKKEKNCTIFGIDNDKKSCKLAKKRIDKVICADVENIKQRLPKKYFNFIIFADVLEHTKDPKKVISDFKKYLKKNGEILISLPNIAHPLIRINLLLGKWEYQKYGILDNMHLRFFTYKTAKELLKNSRLKIIDENFTGKTSIIKTFSSQFIFRCRVK